MNVQLFDQHDHPRFRMYTSEHVWKRFWTHVQPLAVAVAGESPIPDFELAPSLLPDIVRLLEADLASAKQVVQASSLPGPFSQVEILGDVLQLNLRVESHARLQRLAVLHGVLSRLVAERVSVRVMFVPPLESSRYYLATVLQRQTGSVNRDQVRTALMEEYDRLITSNVATDELKTIWRRDRAALEDDVVMEELLDDLVRWGLLCKSPNEMQIAATPKLMMIVP